MRRFGVSISLALCATLALWVQAAGGCAQGGGDTGSNRSNDGEDEEGSSYDGSGNGSGDSGNLAGGSGDTGDTSGATSGGTSTSGNSGATTSGASSGGPQSGPCCSASASAGCSDAAVEQCVCAEDDYCCTTEWNDECVFLVDDLGCGSCGGSSSSGASSSGGNPAGDCCSGSGTPGCSDPSVEQCVCQADDYCCTTEWNDECVFLVDDLGCGSCGGSSSSSSSGGGGGACCTPLDTPGCTDPAIEQCVCSEDDWCCTESWDETCVDEVDQFGCGACF